MVISLASARPRPPQRTPQSPPGVKSDGYREESPPQNGQGDREEAIRTACAPGGRYRRWFEFGIEFNETGEMRCDRINRRDID